ncbi:MAG TPA: hypothetical protein VN915_10880 [Elusimicrobiota bacterium]|nr:hypothetical protein [Elusimicrobiota bacterium]
MRIHSDSARDASPAELQDKALNLRESVNSSRARMNAQKERLERLRRDLAELQGLVGQPPPAAASPAAPAPRPAPVSKEPAPVSASAAASYRTASRGRAWTPAPYVAIFFAAVGLQVHASHPRVASIALPPMPAVASTAASSPAPLLDDGGGSDEALMLAHDWHMPGDERSLADRLGAGTNPPGSKPEWTAERTGEKTYRVTFTPSGTELGYDFDVDLSSRRVDPTPETAELISPRLTAQR